MSSLRSFLDELESEDLAAIDDRQLEADVIELHGAIESLQAHWLRRVAELDARRLYANDGFLSAAAWLVERCRMAAGAARERVRVARLLGRMPRTEAAFGSGELSYAHLRPLVGAAEAHPEVFSDHEETLVGVARSLSVTDLWRAVAYWRQALDGEEGLGEANRRYARRRLHVSRTLGGMVRLDGDLDPEGGQVLLTALQGMAFSVPPDSEDHRTPAQRRADGLVELARQWLDSGAAPEMGGERPHLTVVVDLATLEGRAGQRCELEGAGPLPGEAARRLACDAGVFRVITSGASEPLDVGRRTRTPPASLRRALVVRDGGCRFPGCDRPHWWCDAHHVIHWLDEGPTSLANLVLLCRRHHRLVHEGGFHLERMDGKLRFRRPDWSVIPERSPPIRV